jgi:outer membrane protein assembly factor BamB
MPIRKSGSAAALAFLVCGALHAQSQWPMFQADESHSGYLPVAIDVASIKLRWQKSITTKALNPATTSGDMVFVSEKASSSAAALRALNAADGTVAWTVSLGTPFSVNPPSYANGSVYLQTCNNSSDTWLRCYDAATGAKIFVVPHGAQWENYFAPTIKDGTVYIDGGTYGGMYAFDGTTGAQLWFNGLQQYDEWTPAVDATCAYSYVGGVFYAVKRSDGTTAYTITDPNYSWSGYSMNLAPVLGSMNEALVIYGGRLVSFDLSKQNIAYDVSGSFTGQPAVHGGVIYAVDGGTLYAIDEATGARLWSWSDVGKTLIGTVIVTDSHVFVRNPTRVHAVDPVLQTSVWNYKDSGAMSLGAGALFLARSDGTVTALEYAQLPSPHAVVPSRSHYVEAPITATIQGSGFQDGTTPTVKFAGVDATDVVVVDDATITCTVPANGPGVADVTVQNGVGSGTLANGFVFAPAAGIEGNVARGSTIDVTYFADPGDQIFAITGLPPLEDVPTPPFGGALGIVPFQVFFLLDHWPLGDFTVQLQIPNDPALAGFSFALQGLSGPALVGKEKNGAWTNCLELTIQ